MIKLHFTTITPLHISNGEQLAYGLDYVIKDEFKDEFKDEYLCRFNQKRVAEVIAQEKLFDFKNNYNFEKVVSVIEQNADKFRDDDFNYKIFISDEFSDFSKEESRVGQKIVQEFVNSNGKFYIPASSVKGALYTILKRDPKIANLGIKHKEPKIEDKFVMHDSDYLNSEDFIVERADRPPQINLIALNINKDFSLKITHKGTLDIKELKSKLEKYSDEQMKKAKKFTDKYKKYEKTMGGAARYFEMLERMLSEMKTENEEYLINLGFGGGSYYKIYETEEVPKFKNPGRQKREEEAHTTFSVNIDGENYQLGWCRMKIEVL